MVDASRRLARIAPAAHDIEEGCNFRLWGGVATFGCGVSLGPRLVNGSRNEYLIIRFRSSY
jgi:hypothetical protein